MPEGDTIASAARRIRGALLGSVPELEPRHPRTRGWERRLSGRVLTHVETHGKHLLLGFDGDLVIYSHLRMTGAWSIGPVGRRWPRAPRRAWLVLRSGEHEVVQFDGPVLELLTALRLRSDPRIAQLGPDVLADEFDAAAFLHRLRQDDPTRAFGDALLDQRIVAGLGTIWRAESLFDARVDPLTPTGHVSDAQALAVIAAARPRMAASAAGERGPRETHVYRKARCPACGEAVQSRGLGDDNRTLYWCPSCQR